MFIQVSPALQFPQQKFAKKVVKSQPSPRQPANNFLATRVFKILSECARSRAQQLPPPVMTGNDHATFFPASIAVAGDGQTPYFENTP
jgi:hypothetical protein